jgi:hypothetical protein
MRPCIHCGNTERLEPLGEGVFLCPCGRITKPSGPPVKPDPRVPYDVQGFVGGVPED